MDGAFVGFHDIVDALLQAFGDELVDDAAGVRSHIYEVSIDTPLELDVRRADSGALQVGSTPPLYYVDTTFRPSFHRLRLTAERKL